MTDTFSADALLDFLAHAGERGLMPVATARAIAVSTRNVFGVLTDDERQALTVADVDAVIKRFVNKRARDFTPDSLKEYGRRVKRAVDLYVRWRDDPANFSVATRNTSPPRKRVRAAGVGDESTGVAASAPPTPSLTVGERMASSFANVSAGYETRFLVRPGHLVTLANVPHDLSATEARRFARFVEQLTAEQTEDSAGAGRPA